MSARLSGKPWQAVVGPGSLAAKCGNVSQALSSQARLPQARPLQILSVDRVLSKTLLPRMPNRLDPIDGSRDLDEQMLSMIVSLVSEVSILRARLDACERLLVGHGVLPQGAIDAFEPDAKGQEERDAQRRHIIAKVLRPLTEAAAREAEAASKEP